MTPNSAETNVALEPIRLEDIPPADLVVCPSCKTVVSLHDVEDVQEVSLETGVLLGTSKEINHGVFCPNCRQKLFDHRTWAKHLAQRLLDEPKEEDEGEIVGELDPEEES